MTQGDPMTRAVALLLVAMSIASWTVIVIKAIERVGIRCRAVHAEARFRGAGGAAGAMHTLGEQDSQFVDLVHAVSRRMGDAVRHLRRTASRRRLTSPNSR
ncbi:hypothetical protein WL34_15655 [Burkholderia cepacia]|uniref:hypothetical protein n=1 Tax=Burkholderia cepacia TaxID=292 RepID=UPI00075AFD9B|nr:hypothetical protein [Burkholderia cepacia]KWB37437.1 hypothetical protein WL34_15655 [Burkholderia cepacia]